MVAYTFLVVSHTLCLAFLLLSDGMALLLLPPPPKFPTAQHLLTEPSRCVIMYVCSMSLRTVCIVLDNTSQLVLQRTLPGDYIRTARKFKVIEMAGFAWTLAQYTETFRTNTTSTHQWDAARKIFPFSALSDGVHASLLSANVRKRNWAPPCNMCVCVCMCVCSLSAFSV